METVSGVYENNIFNEMTEMVNNQRLIERESAYKSVCDGALEEALDTIESDYVFNLSKVDEIGSLLSRSEELQRKFLQQKFYIEYMNISEKAKIQTILTSACILNRINTRTQDLKQDLFYLLSMAMIPIPLEQYGIYGDILSHPLLLQSIISKSLDKDEQLEMCNDIFDYCDECSYEGMTDIEYQRAIKNSIRILDKYEVSKEINKQL